MILGPRRFVRLKEPPRRVNRVRGSHNSSTNALKQVFKPQIEGRGLAPLAKEAENPFEARFRVNAVLES